MSPETNFRMLRRFVCISISASPHIQLDLVKSLIAFWLYSAILSEIMLLTFLEKMSKQNLLRQIDNLSLTAK